MFENPRGIRCYMVGYKIQNQAQSPLSKHLPRYSETRRSAEMFIYDVTAHAVSRTDIIGRDIVRQRRAEIGLQTGVFIRNANACRTTLPDAHEPYGIHTGQGEHIPLLCWNATQRDGALIISTQFIEPDPRIHL